MKSNEIRAKFLDYFAAKGHTIVASAPLNELAPACPPRRLAK